MAKMVRAWVVPWEGQYNGPYHIPCSDQAYRAHKSQIDAVLPTHGGTLRPETGEWFRHESASGEFSRYLRRAAKRAGQEYVPVFNQWPQGAEGERQFLELLKQPRRWSAIAEGFVEMAQASSDWPWDGTIYDFYNGGSVGAWSVEVLRTQQEFCRTMAEAAQVSGLPFGVAYIGIVPEDESWNPSLDTFREFVDFLEYYMFIYWDKPYSPSPYWWAKESIENVLRHGIEPGRIYLGIQNVAYYYDFDERFKHWITHADAMQIVRENGATVEWVEDHEAGLIREKYAAIGDNGHLWIHDGDTVRPRLALVDKYGLGGVMLFVLGCGAESVWQAIRAWKRPSRPQRVRAGAMGMTSSSGPAGGYLIGKDRG